MITISDQGAALDAEAIECLQAVDIEIPNVTGLELQAWAEAQLAREDSVLVKAVLQNIVTEIIAASRLVAPSTSTLQ